MSKSNIKLFYLMMCVTFVCLFCCGCRKESPSEKVSKRGVVIVCPADASYLESLASKEIRRYLYLRTGQLLPIIPSNGTLDLQNSLIIIGQKKNAVIKTLIDKDALLAASVGSLEAQQYLIKTINYKDKRTVLIAGGDSIGTVYGAYRFIEHFGVRFYLHGDTIPDAKIAMELPELDEVGKPLFELRGIHPFHDFPEGPDWWDVEAYKAVLAQLPKMRMNFIGLHTYGERDPNCQFGNSEPTVWVGISQDINPDGTVKLSYPSRHYTTLSATWGYRPTNTGDYSFGAEQMFDCDDYSADYMRGMSPWPGTAENCNELFNRFGAVLNNAFSFAHQLGIKTCVGTEMPLTVPKPIKQRLMETGKEACDAAVVQEVYEGMFERITKAYPIDYYMLWTRELWTWLGAKDKEVEETLADLRAVIAAGEKLGAPFTLATAGWVLGPQGERTLFDNVLPKNMPMGCINRDVGFAYVEPNFAGIKERPKWSMPWLEDDPAITIPQLWVGRMRRDAADSLAYGCTGLIGIHWRTRIIGPNISALAQAGWEQHFVPKNHILELGQLSLDPNTEPRDLPADDFYTDWALAEFGREAAGPIAEIFIGLDGGPFSDPNTQHKRKTNLPRPATWVDGPGGIKPDNAPWEEAGKAYEFVDEFAKLRTEVKGAGNLERFDYWLNNFRYLRAVGKVRCTWGHFNAVMEKVKAEKDLQGRKQLAKQLALPIRRELVEQVADVHRYLLAMVNTTGEMGNVTTWQQHIIPELLTESGQQLAAIMDEELPADARPSKKYAGPVRFFVPTIRSSLAAGEDLKLKVIILAEDAPAEAVLYWSPMGENKYEEIPLSHIARGVYSVVIPAGKIKEDDLEYYIKVTAATGEQLYFPATAPQINQTVVILADEAVIGFAKKEKK